MLTSSDSVTKGTTISGTICIVGAGAAGISLALQLADYGIDVVLLESGGLQYSDADQDLYEGENVGLDYYSLETSRQRFFGGTTNHWGGWTRPLDDLDFSPRDWIPNSGWPINEDDLAPYYEAAAGILDLKGSSYELDYWQRKMGVGFAINEGDFETRIVRHSAPTRFGKAYRPLIKKSRTIKAFLKANLTNIKLSPDRRKIETVFIRTLKGNSFSVRANFFVLACGGIENARLLLSFNQKDNPPISDPNNLVGAYFADHVSSFLGTYLLTRNPDRVDYFRKLFLPVGQFRKRPVITPGLTLSPHALEKERLPNVGAIIKHKVDSNPGMPFIYKSARGARAFNLYASIEPIPNPDSRVNLSRTDTDTLGMPRPQLDFRLHDHYWSLCERTAEVFARQFSASGLGRVRTGDLGDLGNGMQKFGFHHMGTTRMHSDPDQGVVDADCKVHGLDNLFIAGSSVFPTFGYAQPTFTIIVLALRQARHLAQLARKGSP